MAPDGKCIVTGCKPAAGWEAVMHQRKLSIHGVKYHVAVEGDGVPLLLLHGFTGSWKSWAGLIPRLAERFQVVIPDLLGHGESDAPAEAQRYGMQATVEDLIALLRNLGHERFACLGYSMGGRIALSVACQHPDAVSALALESASPGLETEAERSERIQRDEALARRIETVGVPQFVKEWEQIPLFKSQRILSEDVLASQRAIRLSQRAAGLAGSLRGVGTGVQPSLWSALHILKMPVLLLTGTLDTKFQKIAEKMQQRIEQARHLAIPGAGHTVHLEQPALYTEAVLDFLKG